MIYTFRDLAFGDIVQVEAASIDTGRNIKYRVGVVLSNPDKNGYLNGMVSIAPVLKIETDYPLHVTLKDGNGVILMEHHRMVNLEEREFTYLGKVSEKTLLTCKKIHLAIYEGLYELI